MTPTPDQTPEMRDADCPICGKFARNWNSNNCKLSCSDTSCPGFKIDLHPNEWNHRPLEDALRARLAEAEKVRDAAYREAEILRTNATYVKKVLDCANRYMPDLVKGAITVEGAIQERDTLRATNATLAERVRRLEEAEWAKHWRRFVELGEMLEETKDDSAQERQPALTERAWLIDQLNAMAESILTDSASPDPVLPIKLAFCSLHQAWLVAHHRSCMNETMDALAVVLGLDPMNPSKGLPTPGAKVGKEGE